MLTHSSISRISKLRQAMQQQSVHAWLIPTADPHLSEYLPDHWQARVYFSGFTGSAGSLLVTIDDAWLWTDSRYHEQAEHQLEGSGIKLMRAGNANVPSVDEWLHDHMHAGQVLAVAGDSISTAKARSLRQHLSLVKASLRTNIDLPASVWKKRPKLPEGQVFVHPLSYAIESRAQKLARVCEAMHAAGATHHLVSTLDDIAWILNLRGNDVDYNPVFLAHLLIDEANATLFIDPRKLDDTTRQALDQSSIEVADYTSIDSALSTLASEHRILYSPNQVVAAISAAIPKDTQLIELPNPSTAMKAIKSTPQLAHIDAVMREDGAALVRGFRIIEERLKSGKKVTELDVSDILFKTRSKRAGFVSESFGTIAGYGKNAALPHYSASQEQHSDIQAHGLLLVDSGGQYLGGTTDITRVWACGDTSQDERQDYTHVLKGMIALSRAVFPEGASGPQLDALARAPIWAAFGDFGHGTGHGVGYFLNVHEGPQSIRPPRTGTPNVALEEGMITSIEPGIYKPGRHGIRHENLAVVEKAQTTEFGLFYRFRTLTLCPFDSRAMDMDLLSKQDIDWLNAYHRKVQKELLPLLDDPADQAWLKERCQPV